MKNFVQIKTREPSGLYNVEPLLKRLAASDPKVWREDTYLRDYPQGPFGDTESIILRFPTLSVDRQRAEILTNPGFDQHENIWMPTATDFPEFVETVYKLAYEAKATRIGRVMINKLNPGGRVYAHADTPAHANYWCRFHLVVGAFPGVDFRCGDEHVEMHTGEIWFFRNEFEHEVHNLSPHPRIHMIVDLRIAEIKGPGYEPQRPTN